MNPATNPSVLVVGGLNYRIETMSFSLADGIYHIFFALQ